MPEAPSIVSLDAVTLEVEDMAASVAFFNTLGFDRIKFGGADSPFTSYKVGKGHLNLQLVREVDYHSWGRPIFHVAKVSDVDALHAAAVAAGYQPDFAPTDAPWGERYFHIQDPDGHEISIACPLPD
ncbi:MAG TPA: VOC family protein [Acidimicrobiales bacterium]|nr:VOC family protein [Acidimicrobiales bacterium]